MGIAGIAQTQLLNTVSIDRILLVKNALVSSVALVVFDYIITFGQEINFIWNSHWSCIKALFLINRYTCFSISVFILYSFAHAPDKFMCNAMINAASWTALLGIAIADVILCIRTYAIWGRSRAILSFLVAIYAVGMTPAIIVRIRYGDSLRVGPAPVHILGCFITDVDSFIYVECIFVLAFETIIMFLTSWKAIYHLKGRHAPRTPLLVTFFRDGLLYYIFMVMITLSNTIIIAVAPTEYVSLPMGFQRALHSILSGRIILHMRETAMKEQEWSSNEVGSIPVFSSEFHRVEGSESSSTFGQLSWNSEKESGSSLGIERHI